MRMAKMLHRSTALAHAGRQMAWIGFDLIGPGLQQTLK